MTANFKNRAANIVPFGEKITATRIQKIKRQAKALSGRDGLTHMEALDSVCAQEGFGNWENVLRLISTGPNNLTVSPKAFQEAPPQDKPKGFAIYEAFAAKSIEFFEPRGEHFRIMRIGPAYFSLCIGYAEITLCRIEPRSAQKRTLKILDSVALGPCQVDRPSREDLEARAYINLYFGQAPLNGLWICKYDPQQPRIWVGDLPEDMGLIALQKELGVGFGHFIRSESRLLYENTTEQTGYYTGEDNQTAFESSSAYLDLLTWSRKNPKKAEEESLRDHYMRGWYVKAKEMGFL